MKTTKKDLKPVNNKFPIIEEVPCVYPSDEEVKQICENAFEEDREAITRAILYLKERD